MKQVEIITKLNENHNFHLSLKVIQFADLTLIKEFEMILKEHNKTYITICDLDNSYDLLLKAHDEKIDYILCNNSINFVLPLVNVITIDDLSIIKPIIPVYFYLKDNRIAQKVKTKCHQQNIPFIEFRSKQDLIDGIKNIMKL